MSRSNHAALIRKACAGAAVGIFGCAAAWGQTQAIIPADANGNAATSAPAAAGPAIAPATPSLPAPANPVPPISAAPVAPASPASPTPVVVAPATGAVTPADAGPAPTAVTLPAAGTPILPGPLSPAAPAAVTAPAVTSEPTAAAPVASSQPTASAPPIETVAPPPTTVASAPAPEIPPGKAIPRDGNSYPITELKIGYRFPHPELPPINDLLNSQITLGEVDDGFVGLRPGVKAVTMRLGDIGKQGATRIYRSGITTIYAHILHYLNDKNIIGVFVVVDPEDIKTAPGESADVDKDVDVRNGRTSLQLVIVTSTVKQVRTVEIGDVSTPNRVNDPQFDTIRAHSPLQPAIAGSTTRNDLLRKDVLDDYRLLLNRVQGRRVDVAISGTNDAGEVYLDYLIAEAKPWYAYAQLSNTGTSQTSDWRERFGFVDTQLTHHDDVLSIDYMTADFSKSHGITASYELPVLALERLRNRVYTTWNEFTASDVGQSAQDFTGSSWSVGDELVMNIYQKRELFVDALAGFRAQYTESIPQNGGTPGKAAFYEPYLGLKLERITDVASTVGDVTFTGFYTQADYANDVAGLGRTDPSHNPHTMMFDFLQTFYLEPLLDPKGFATGSSTLANEVAISMKGQWAFNNRLFPQAQDVAGGLYTVRGYPESIVAGDSVIIGSLEYRFHVPRAFAVVEDPTKTPLFGQAFRYSPQQPYGRPDWDLIMKAFFDTAEVVNSDRERNVHEIDSTLASVGVGMELQIKQNFNLRVDYGIPLENVKDPTGGNKNAVTAGDGRFHISTTILY